LKKGELVFESVPLKKSTGKGGDRNYGFRAGPARVWPTDGACWKTRVEMELIMRNRGSWQMVSTNFPTYHFTNSTSPPRCAHCLWVPTQATPSEREARRARRCSGR